MRKALNAIKDEPFPWMREVTKNAPQQAIKNLGNAFANFFDDLDKHRRGKLARKRVKLPVVGWVRMREEVRFAGRILSVTVCHHGEGWYASFSVQAPYEVDPHAGRGRSLESSAARAIAPKRKPSWLDCTGGSPISAPTCCTSSRLP